MLVAAGSIALTSQVHKRSATKESPSSRPAVAGSSSLMSEAQNAWPNGKPTTGADAAFLPPTRTGSPGKCSGTHGTRLRLQMRTTPFIFQKIRRTILVLITPHCRSYDGHYRWWTSTAAPEHPDAAVPPHLGWGITFPHDNKSRIGAITSPLSPQYLKTYLLASHHGDSRLSTIRSIISTSDWQPVLTNPVSIPSSSANARDAYHEIEEIPSTAASAFWTPGFYYGMGPTTICHHHANNHNVHRRF